MAKTTIKKAAPTVKRVSRAKELAEIKQSAIKPAPAKQIYPIVPNPGRILVTKPNTSSGVVGLQVSILMKDGTSKNLIVQCASDSKGRYTVTVEPTTKPITEIWKSFDFEALALPPSTNVGLLVSEEFAIKVLALKNGQEVFSVKIDQNDPQIIIVINGSALGFK